MKDLIPFICGKMLHGVCVACNKSRICNQTANSGVWVAWSRKKNVVFHEFCSFPFFSFKYFHKRIHEPWRIIFYERLSSNYRAILILYYTEENQRTREFLPSPSYQMFILTWLRILVGSEMLLIPLLAVAEFEFHQSNLLLYRKQEKIESRKVYSQYLIPNLPIFWCKSLYQVLLLLLLESLSLLWTLVSD